MPTGLAGSPRARLEGKRVAITGGRGALGRPLVAALLDAGVERVTTLGRQSPDVLEPALCGPSVRHFVGNILDPSAVDAAFRGCSVVFHLAGLSPAECLSRQIVRAYEVNTQGAVQVLDACHRCGVSRLIYVSTALVYGHPQFLPVTEDHPAAPLTVYAASKLAAEVALQAAASRLGVRCDIARLSWVYGTSFDATTLVGRALSQATTAHAIVLRHLGAMQDFLYEDDAAAALIALACTDGDGTASRILNVSSGVGTSVGTMARTLAGVAAEAGLGRVTVTESAAPAPASPDLVVDNARVRRLTGWMPRVELEDGLRRALRSWMQTSGPAPPFTFPPQRAQQGSRSS
ncbi:MAG: NAD(P)-dependent oxidoreductase [Acidobacteria bacterium]|nr:NAD(P)-dependent oxidoreductase [Acidobacteriota bacterium]